MTKPINNILPRQIENDGLRDLLNNFSNGIDETVNFGTHILKWDTEYSRGRDEQIPILMSFRHYLELIDAISILVKHSSIDPCKIILRGAMETYFGLEYIFEKNTFDRCMAFLVWHTHNNLKIYKKLDTTTEQGKQFQNTLNTDKSIKGMNISDIPERSPAIQNLESLLQRPEYQKAEQEYQRLIKTRERNPSWYRLFEGPKNIKELADYLKLSALYEVLYRHWSGPIHGTEIIQGKLSGGSNGLVDIVQIRYPKDAQSVTSYAVSISLKVFSLFVDNRIPHKKQEYLEWYKSMREFYLRVTGKEQLIKME